MEFDVLNENNDVNHEELFETSTVKLYRSPLYTDLFRNWFPILFFFIHYFKSYVLSLCLGNNPTFIKFYAVLSTNISLKSSLTLPTIIGSQETELRSSNWIFLLGFKPLSGFLGKLQLVPLHTSFPIFFPLIFSFRE